MPPVTDFAGHDFATGSMQRDIYTHTDIRKGEISAYVFLNTHLYTPSMPGPPPFTGSMGGANPLDM